MCFFQPDNRISACLSIYEDIVGKQIIDLLVPEKGKSGSSAEIYCHMWTLEYNSPQDALR